jgi:hypothetical protein
MQYGFGPRAIALEVKYDIMQYLDSCVLAVARDTPCHSTLLYCACTVVVTPSPKPQPQCVLR